MITLIIGGASSGKTRFALEMSSRPYRLSRYTISDNKLKAYIATAQALDDEMRKKVLRHQAERNKDWETFEEPLYPHHILRRISADYPIVIIDCLTMWLANMMMQQIDIDNNINDFIETISTSDTNIFLVTNEVGLSIVPDNDIARLFRQEAGILNQKISAIAHEVHFVISGLAMRLK